MQEKNVAKLCFEEWDVHHFVSNESPIAKCSNLEELTIDSIRGDAYDDFRTSSLVALKNVFAKWPKLSFFSLRNFLGRFEYFPRGAAAEAMACLLGIYEYCPLIKSIQLLPCVGTACVCGDVERMNFDLPCFMCLLQLETKRKKETIGGGIRKRWRKLESLRLCFEEETNFRWMKSVLFDNLKEKCLKELELFVELGKIGKEDLKYCLSKVERGGILR